MLLLDEEDDVVVVDCGPPVKQPRTEMTPPSSRHASSVRAVAGSTPATVAAPRQNMRQRTDGPRSVQTPTSPSPAAAATAVAAGGATSHRATEATFHVRGGDGMDKIAALAYGAPRVQAIYSPPPPITPAAHSRGPRAAGDGAEARGTTRQDCTQPMTVSAATTSSTRSSADYPDASREGASSGTSRSQGASDGVVDVDASSQSTRTIGTPLPPVSRSLRGDLNNDDDDSAAAPSGTRKTANLPTTPPKQMNLADFFAKMKCKASQ